MSYEQNTIEAVIGTFDAVARQGPVKGLTDKLQSVTVGTPEAYYMLATYCFDLSRKLEYLTKVAHPFAEHVPPELAHDIIEDNNAINAKNLTWEERAKVAEKIMIQRHRELVEEPDRSLKQSTHQVAR
jgi:hypothetical protein